MSKTTRKQTRSGRTRPMEALGTALTPSVEASVGTTIAALGPSARLEAPGAGGIRPDDAESMSRLEVYFDGRNYRYQDYRYERLGDALAYARRMQSRHRDDRASASPARQCAVQSPSDSQRRLMQQLSISYEAGTYRLGGFRYDKLADAVGYARTCLHRYIAGRSEAGDVLSALGGEAASPIKADEGRE